MYDEFCYLRIPNISDLNLICILITCNINIGQNNTENITDNITNLNKQYDKYKIKKKTKETPVAPKMTSLALKKIQAIPKKLQKHLRKHKRVRNSQYKYNQRHISHHRILQEDTRL